MRRHSKCLEELVKLAKGCEEAGEKKYECFSDLTEKLLRSIGIRKVVVYYESPAGDWSAHTYLLKDDAVTYIYERKSYEHGKIRREHQAKRLAELKEGNYPGRLWELLECYREHCGERRDPSVYCYF